MRWILSVIAVLAWRTYAADASAPASDQHDDTQTEHLVIAPKAAIVLRSGVLAPAGDSTLKPVLVYEKYSLTIGPSAAKATHEAKPAGDKGKPAEKPKDSGKKTFEENNAGSEASRVPVLRLPIQFPSTSITSAGGPNGRFQVTGDGQLETREIVAPLPLSAYYGQSGYTTKVTFSYGAGSGYEKPKASEPKK